jgi:hypothetical protein
LRPHPTFSAFELSHSLVNSTLWLTAGTFRRGLKPANKPLLIRDSMGLIWLLISTTMELACAVVLPAAEIADMTGAPDVSRPRLRRVHDGAV